MLPVVQRGLGVLDQLRGMAVDLKLSDEQKSEYDGILQIAAQDLRGMIPKLLEVQPPVRRQQVLTYLNGLPEKIKPVLTSEQKVIFDQEFAQIRQGFAAPPAQVGAAPATQPGRAPGIGVALERLKDYVTQIDLTDEQKTRVEKLFTDTRQELLDLRGSAVAPTPAMQEKAQGIIQDLRAELARILTPGQAEHLRDLANRGALNSGSPAMGDATGMMGGMAAATQPTQRAANPMQALPTPEVPLIEIGQAAPEFSLKRLDGQPLAFSSLKGKYVLLIFGSYSSPSFRQRAAAIEQIKTSYGTRLNPFIIYTRENYPAGQWNVDRNKDDGIAIEQPTDMNGRLSIARQARSALKLTVPILMDTMEDTTAKAYGGFTNAAILIDRDGKVVARQKWFEPYALRRMIDEVLKTPAADKD